MSQTQQLVSTLKRLAKARGITYAKLARHLHRSEATIKRQFSQQSFSLKTLETICDFLHIDLADLIRAAEIALPVHQLSAAQEADLVADPRRVLVAVCVLNHWTPQQIIATYTLTQAQCITHLTHLDRLGLIQLMPENRIKLKVARDFAWLPDGPIQQFFRHRAQDDFLEARFNQTGEMLRFQHGMLTPQANARFQQRLQRLLVEFAELHADCIQAPSDTRFGTSVLVALRPWEPQVLEALRRVPDARRFPSE